MASLEQDLEQWCGKGGMESRPVTTVHFGGGTPSLLAPALTANWIALLRGRLAVNEQTQWAIETTSEESAPQQVERFLTLGFRRLHVGVQTLQNDLRRRLGRSSPADKILERLRCAIRMGMVVSVDILYGLPGQTAVELVDDLQRLTDEGIHGVSLYRLNLPTKRQQFLREFPGFERRPLRAFVMLQAAERALLHAGYCKNHFAHYARSEDDNCYYRHALRGEDLMGLGASASGNVGPWEYRCLFYARYVRHAHDQLPIAVLARSPLSPCWRRLATALMAGAVATATIPPQPAAARLVERWLRAGLLAEDAEYLRVTAGGTWLLAAMLRELAGAENALAES
jgi:oxygen-independent coproporphyrinogen-3 oxidase